MGGPVAAVHRLGCGGGLEELPEELHGAEDRGVRAE